jgi:hypothetical protein
MKFCQLWPDQIFFYKTLNITNEEIVQSLKSEPKIIIVVYFKATKSPLHFHLSSRNIDHENFVSENIATLHVWYYFTQRSHIFLL